MTNRLMNLQPAADVQPHMSSRQYPDTWRQDAPLTALRRAMLAEELARVPDRWQRRLLRLAAGEAEALAWTTPVPMLFFPDLFAEKVEGVRKYVEHQATLRRDLSALGDIRPRP